MPLRAPVLDDRNFEQLLDEAKRRIPVFTPEWTNFGGESDPGITLVQLFAFLTDTLLYRANRVPERNRVKFLQLLGIPLQPAAPATGLICIHNDRGPLEALPLNAGVVVSAGNVEFRTLDGVNVLPLEAQAYYKRPVLENDPRYSRFQAQFEAVRLAAALEAGDTGTAAGTGVRLVFYETISLPPATPAEPNPLVDLTTTLDRALYIALLAPPRVEPEAVRAVIANQVLSLGIVPSSEGEVKPLQPLQLTARSTAAASLAFELPTNVSAGATAAQYLPLTPLVGPDVLETLGVVQLQLPGLAGLRTWAFTDPLQEGAGTFPPRLEDEQISKRLVTWLRLRPRLPAATDPSASPPPIRLSWVGINAARVRQAVAVVNELLGQGSGEPDQIVTLANTPVLPDSIVVVTQDPDSGAVEFWQPTDDLLAAGADDPVFTLDPEAGRIRFGDGLRGARPPANQRILASYEYGGGPQGNVAAGAIKASPDPRLQGGYRVENPVATSGGNLGESAEQGERRIPRVLQHRDRLVTWQDFREVTARAPGADVGRVEVLPLFRPSSSGAPSQNNLPGVVTLLVVPRFDAVNPLWPTPDRPFLQRVCDYLDRRRLVTTEIHIRGPDYRPVYVAVGIQVRGGFFPDVVKQMVRDQLYAYLSALPPGGPDGTGWPLDKAVLNKDLEAVVTRVPGVEFVNSLRLGEDPASATTDINGRIDLAGLQLPRLADLRVTEGEAEPLTAVSDPVIAIPGGGSVPADRVVPVPVLKTTC
jgi:hypothetical protein